MRYSTAGFCRVKGCPNRIQGRGWCGTHYTRWRKYGSPMGYVTLEQQLLERIVIDDNGCWLWTSTISRAPRNCGGYGKHGKDYAHRLAYESWVGPIPLGTEIDHLCRVRRCIRPSHLEAVTRQVNLLRGQTFAAGHAAKTHCPAGHEYTPENTSLSAKNQRTCRTCHARHERNRKARLRGEVQTATR